ncbi:putative LPS assembly protein LptD [Parafilimonas sp.]|uniref:putative LPS assembly protein LptD n=1 Tax=Parafilimonas sp. TaxID=1969739 RepID=UPI003F7F8FDE
MQNQYKLYANIKTAIIFLCVLTFITFPLLANSRCINKFQQLLTIPADTIPARTDSGISGVVDTLPAKKAIKKPVISDSISFVETDSLSDSSRRIVVDTTLFSKDSLDAPISYTAEDSAVLHIPTKQFLLYGKANTTYTDMKLDANTIEYDQNKNLIKAYGGTDTSKGALNLPTFVQGDQTSIMDTVFFNLKTQKGLTKNTYYKAGEMFVNAQRVKKVEKDVEYAYRGRFTTCNLDTPHFDIRARKIKIVNDKIAVSGPAFPEFEGVPMPIAIPFGIYPLQRGRHSGLLPPQFTTSDVFGLGLEGLGYYKVINDNWDSRIQGNLYSYGGWQADATTNYYKRYKYRGTFALSAIHTKRLNNDLYSLSKEEFYTSNTYQIRWNHSSDSKARPGTTFSASVQAGSTQYNQNLTNNAMQNFNNNLASSITYSKTWGLGNNLSVSLNETQNSVSRLINMNLPTVSFTTPTIYPFQKKEQVGSLKWYQKLGIGYSGNLLNVISFYDSAMNFRKILDTMQWGVTHRIPITLTLPALGPLVLAPSINYQENWYAQKIDYSNWNKKSGKVDTSIERGFYAAREMSFGMSMNTRIFGTYNFKNSKLRHEIDPSIGISYKPNLVSKYYKNVIVDSNNQVRRISQLQGNVLGGFSEGRFGGITFGISNLLEMKKRNTDSSSADSVKKVRILDNLSITSGYNLIPDSANKETPISPISISAGTNLFNKINITANATINPYRQDTSNHYHLLWKEGKIGQFQQGNLSLSTSLKSKSKKDDRTDEERLDDYNETLTPDEQQSQLDYIRSNPAEFVDFNTPWSLQLSYSLGFTRMLQSDLIHYKNNLSTNVNVNGTISLSPKWQLGGGFYFDIITRKLQASNFFLTRDMHCWQMTIDINVGLYKSFTITLNPKSGILRDLRINKRFMQQ